MFVFVSLYPRAEKTEILTDDLQQVSTDAELSLAESNVCLG